MTYSSSGPSLAQAPDVDQPLSSSDSSSSSSNSHSHSHSSSHSSYARSNSGKRHAHLHRHDSRQVDNTNQDDQDHQQDQSEDQGGSERSIDTVSRLRHSHRRHQFRGAETALKLEIRDDTATGYVTQVVQTVSVVQVVDSVGSPIAVQTLYADPNTIVVDSASGSTISVSNPESSAAAAPASNAASTNDVAQSSNDMTSLVASTPAADATSGTDSAVYLVPTSVSSSGLLSASYSDILNTLQDPAQTPGASGTGIIGSFNGTNTTPTAGFSSSASSQASLTETNLSSTPVASSQTTSDATSKLTSYSVEKNVLSTPTTRSSTSSSISSFSSASATDTTDLSSTNLSSTIYSYSTETWTSTQYADGGGSGGDATSAEQPADATTTLEASGSSTSGSLTQTQKQVIGGVVGSIAGVAVLALLIMFALKYKKRQGALLGDNNQPRPYVKGLITGGDPGSGSGGAMAERAGPFAVAAALAGLTGKRSNLSPTDAAPSGERGFYRVSGKKLPSVLQTGGDGYTDPRDSVASGHTDYWRGSQAFDPSSDGSNRLALGSPMRPVSGVPIIRTGPARTPITEENPFGDPISRPRPDSDVFGDSIGAGSVHSRDGSYGSPSRFQEKI
ncbi:hypothetical protein B0J13DRAFT_259065 [Dactylonectria estremocensis]|uniref:Uncharacterized protein n=1 Tax=Dactylonectria estremocensis TaxID=1079267 RepID=A0A9P9F2D9_9HYPO|nr:hypothetical protein B0J13DRAFT_259065 [Dactylonectria estremocensis]